MSRYGILLITLIPIIQSCNHVEEESYFAAWESRSWPVEDVENGGAGQHDGPRGRTPTLQVAKVYKWYLTVPR